MTQSRPIPDHGKFLTTDVIIEFDEHGRHGELKTLVQYRDRTGLIHMAHPGLMTDGRSGRIGYYLIGAPFRTKQLRACVIHDWYCSTAQLLPPGKKRARIRLTGDRLFGEMLAAIGVGRFKRWTMVRGVRLGTWYARNKPASPWFEDFASIDIPKLPTTADPAA